jgi:hypothetical protein
MQHLKLVYGSTDYNRLLSSLKQKQHGFNDGRSVGIVRSRTQTMEFSLVLWLQ